MLSPVEKHRTKKELKDFLSLLEVPYKILKHTYIENQTEPSEEKVQRVFKRIGFYSSETTEETAANIPYISEFKLVAQKLAEEQCLETPNCEECPIKNFCNTYREAKQEEERLVAKPTIVDLFSGAGGFSLGFKQSGYKILLANDIQEVCTKTYKINHPEMNEDLILHDDVANVVSHLDSYIGGIDVDVIIGGPPCQSFSMANRNRVIDDPRNNLYKHFVDSVEKAQPKFFVMENVKGMVKVSEQVMEDFEKIGYDVTCRLLNAKDFSVPQNRERLIFIGNRIGQSSEQIMGEITNQLYPSYVLKDALADIKELKPFRIKNARGIETEESGRDIDVNHDFPYQNNYLALINEGNPSELLFNHKNRFNNDRDIEIYSRMLQGDQSDSERIADIMPYKSRKDIFKDKYFKLIEEKVCKTITAHMQFDCNMYIHPTQSRGLSPREAARVQSYPDYYFFFGPFTKKYMQVGNSVPPLMARRIAEVIKKYI